MTLRSILIFMTVVFCTACHYNSVEDKNALIASGQMPGLATDHSGNIYLVYGHGDSILTSASDNYGRSFSSPVLVSVVPELAASHMRGPQIAATTNGLIITACNRPGNIISFAKDASGKWMNTSIVNDADTTAKENLMALAADGTNAFAVWLDVRSKHNQIYGAKTTDGGKTWSKNMLIYASPDSTVCECCKPCVAIQGKQVSVMFRNWLGGKRDLYLIQSADSGTSFGQAEKLGLGSWALNGCPMDGGALGIAGNGTIKTVWNRDGKIYQCGPAEPEHLLGEGRNCTLSSYKSKTAYAWVEKGNIIIEKPSGEKLSPGKGQLPVIKAIDESRAICVWENNAHIYRSIIAL